MDDIIKKMLSLKTWAVAGSTHNPEKFANKIYKRLKNSNYTVYSLNPGGHPVDGDLSYRTLGSIPDKVDVINMVINPVKGREIVSDAIKLGIKYLWFQPGAESQELIKMAQDAGMIVVYNRCVLVELGE